jgi:hypothetical protein
MACLLTVMGEVRGCHADYRDSEGLGTLGTNG